MDYINGRAREFGEGHQMMHSFSFNDGWTAFIMLLRASLSTGKQFSLALGNEGLIFTMRGDDNPEFLRELEGAIKFCVVNAECTLVSQENLEGAYAASDDFPQ